MPVVSLLGDSSVHLPLPPALLMEFRNLQELGIILELLRGPLDTGCCGREFLLCCVRPWPISQPVTKQSGEDSNLPRRRSTTPSDGAPWIPNPALMTQWVRKIKCPFGYLPSR